MEQQKRIEDAARDVGQTIAEVLPEGFGFIFFVFNFGEGGSLSYMSNAERKDVIETLKEFISRES
jgi:hypothetical protein